MEGIIMADTNAIPSVISGVEAVQPHPVASHKHEHNKEASHANDDTVTISAQAKQAAQKAQAKK
jgi:hypothetical protein